MVMNERLLQFIWQFQYFNKSGLATVRGETVEVIMPGTYNTNQGPDFTAAQIRIGRTIWVGCVEMHIKTSDWGRHAHETDRNYDAVVLHVVWINDDDESYTRSPIIELQTRVPKLLLSRYSALMENLEFVPCQRQIEDADSRVWIGFNEALCIERLERKSARIRFLLDENRHHWEQTFWWLVARNFGVLVNADAFESIARSIDIGILARHRSQLIQLEAMLFGQSHLLDQRFSGTYPVMLQKEYRFLRKKYRLQPVTVRLHFLRMRPGAFPTVRLAQLAALIHHSTSLFAKICESQKVEDVFEFFSVTANDYWHYHFLFDAESDWQPKVVGKEMIANIVINSVIPALYTYGRVRTEQKYIAKAIDWMERMPAENNAIVRKWKQLRVSVRSAIDSQALLELKSGYCDMRRCLDCRIGTNLLKKTIPQTGAAQT
jgi:hypothetical protein